MGVTNEVLRQFTEVGAVDFAEMVNAILLLQEQVALGFFIAQDRFDDALMPDAATLGGTPWLFNSRYGLFFPPLRGAIQRCQCDGLRFIWDDCDLAMVDPEAV